MTTDMNKEIKDLLASYETAPKEKKSGIRRALRSKGFSLRAWNKETKTATKAINKEGAKVGSKKTKATPKQAKKVVAPKAIKPTKVAQPVTVPADDEDEA